ncbi:unnamed protein product [Ixodes persulcatus]
MLCVSIPSICYTKCDNSPYSQMTREGDSCCWHSNRNFLGSTRRAAGILLRNLASRPKCNGVGNILAIFIHFPHIVSIQFLKYLGGGGGDDRPTLPPLLRCHCPNVESFSEIYAAVVKHSLNHLGTLNNRPFCSSFNLYLDQTSGQFSLLTNWLFLAANKRRRTHVDLEVAPRPMEPHPASIPGSVPGNSFPFAPPSSPFPAAKKPRVLFSDEQKEALRLAFSMDPYPSTATIEFLAAELNLSVRTITNWFHNHRMRLKQHVVSPNPDDSPRAPDLLTPNIASRDGSSASFDPALFRGLLVQRLAEIQGDKSGLGPSAFGGNSNSSGNLSIYNSYSPSSQGNDEGTLDLSMSSHNSAGRRERDRPAGGDYTPTEEDDSNLSQDEVPTAAGSDRDSLHDESLARKNLHSHSRRRKPAAPKWVDPGLSPDSEDNEEDEDAGDDEEDESAIINGVCVRQTAGDFSLRALARETIRVDPVAAIDDLARKRVLESRKGDEEETEGEQDDGEEGALELCTAARKPRSEQLQAPQQPHSPSDSINKLEQRLDRDERPEDWEF